MRGGNYHLFTDDNKETTLHGLGFSTLEKSKNSIRKIETYYNTLKKNQQINKYSPKNLRPRVYLDSKQHIEKFYMHQKMYRVLGLLNRAKTIHQRYPNPELEKSFNIFRIWMKKYHKNMLKYAHIKFIKKQS